MAISYLSRPVSRGSFFSLPVFFIYSLFLFFPLSISFFLFCFEGAKINSVHLFDGAINLSLNLTRTSHRGTVDLVVRKKGKRNKQMREGVRIISARAARATIE